jgi:hypothetical protein
MYVLVLGVLRLRVKIHAHWMVDVDGGPSCESERSARQAVSRREKTDLKL